MRLHICLAVMFALLLPPARLAAQSAASSPNSPLNTSAVRQNTPAAPQAARGAAAASGQMPAVAATVTLEPQGFDYEPENRRDPFVSLVRRGSVGNRSATASRPGGLAGLETSEVNLKGTLQTRDGWVAMLEGVDQKTYVVRAGDRLLDGVIRSIVVNAVVIVQQVTDPLSLEKQREVRKTIRQTDEAQ